MSTPQDTLQQALKHHQAGELDAAARLYREILGHDPNHADAWHLVGLVEYSRGRYTEAIDQISRAIALDDAQASFHNHLAEAFLSAGQLSQAEASCRRALALDPQYAIGHNTLGTILAARGNAAEAIEWFRSALALAPHFAQAHCNLGMGLESQGELSDAESSYRCALTCMPDYPQALYALGVVLQLQSRHAESVELYRRLLQLQPRHATGLCNLASALKETRQPAEAMACYEKALSIDPRLVEAHFNLGVIHQAKQQYNQAEAAYRRVIALRPAHAAAHNNLGTLERQQGRLSEALRSFERVLELQPDSAEALSNLGNVFMAQGRRVDAMVCYDQAIRAMPNYAQAHINRALARLALGHFSAGWAEYEGRWQCPDFSPHGHKQPQWDGSPLKNRSLLVHAEQGLGDTLQFARYVPLIDAPDGRLVFEVPPALVPLFRQSGLPGVVARGDALPPCDLQIPLMSMPFTFRTPYDNVPNRTPYLSADPRLVAEWREALGDCDGLKVGIAWQGSATYRGDRFRSIPLRHFAALAIDGVELISLQRGHGVEQIEQLAEPFALRTFDDSFDREHGAFMDTAAVLANVDLVITSDTSVAHLAGALGVPTWLALPIGPDWRWHVDRDDSPWYPTMRLFRQTTFDNWPEVFERLAAALQEVVSDPE